MNKACPTVVHNFSLGLPAQPTPYTIYFIKTDTSEIDMYVTDGNGTAYPIGGGSGDVVLNSPQGTIAIDGYNIDISPEIMEIINSIQQGYVISVSGDLVDNTDPANPIVLTPNLQQVLDQGSEATLEYQPLIITNWEKIEYKIDDIPIFINFSIESTEEGSAETNLINTYDDGSFNNSSKLYMFSDENEVINKLSINQENLESSITLDTSGLKITDTINNKGLIYDVDNTSNQLSDDRAITDVGGVKQLINNATKSRQIVNAPYYYPDWWNGVRIPLSIKNSKALYDYDISNEVVLSDYIPYFISPTGNNSNDGLTELSPKATISNAVSSGAELIYMMPGIYTRDTFLSSGFNPPNNLIIIGIGEVNITTGQPNLSWTFTSNGTYRATRSSVTNVVDFSDTKNKYGFYKDLKFVESQALCESEAGTYFTDNASVWVHTFDGRIPDDKLIVCISLTQQAVSDNNIFYFENLNLYNIELALRGNDETSSLEIYCKNINIPLNQKTPLSATLEYNSFKFANFKKAILQNCLGIESTQDIFNYHNAYGVPNCEVVEIDCKAYNAGLNSPALNNQCSSAHEGIKILRINGNYYGGQDQVIADVTAGTQSILVGCELNINPNQLNGTIFSGCDAELFGCHLFGNKIISETDGTVGVKIYNSIVDYSATIGNVIIN